MSTSTCSTALILLAAWPTAIYFSLLYTESLYLMLTALFLYFLLQDRLSWAAVAAAFAALTRQPGFLCLAPLGLWIVMDTARPWRQRIKRLGWGATCSVLEGRTTAKGSAGQGWSDSS